MVEELCFDWDDCWCIDCWWIVNFFRVWVAEFINLVVLVLEGGFWGLLFFLGSSFGWFGIFFGGWNVDEVSIVDVFRGGGGGRFRFFFGGIWVDDFKLFWGVVVSDFFEIFFFCSLELFFILFWVVCSFFNKRSLVFFCFSLFFKCVINFFFVCRLLLLLLDRGELGFEILLILLFVREWLILFLLFIRFLLLVEVSLGIFKNLIIFFFVLWVMRGFFLILFVLVDNVEVLL